MANKKNCNEKIEDNIPINSYLAGLWEGDGYIYIGKKGNPIWAISFNVKDKLLALKILNIINGKGHIVKHSKNGIELRFSNVKDLIKIISLTNGYYRSPKIYQIYKLIDWLNNNNINLKIPKLEKNTNLLISDSWLAGFIDADGCFYIRFSKTIACRFGLEQRMICPITNISYNLLFEQIQLEFNCGLHIRYRKHLNKNYYSLKFENQDNNKLLINYLTKFPLFSSKFNDYINYVQAFNIILKKNHLIDSGRKEILNLKSTMNDKRTEFTWDHLNKLKL